MELGGLRAHASNVAAGASSGAPAAGGGGDQRSTAAASAAAALASLATGEPSQDTAAHMLYSEPNRTSAIDDILSVVLLVFIVTAFVIFFLILPGIRSEKFPTFVCITSSLLVTSIILVSLFGTTWHVGQAPISAAYKAFSRDRIQGELSVKIGLHSVNITLRAHKYYILHSTQGSMVIMDNSARLGPLAAAAAALRPSVHDSSELDDVEEVFGELASGPPRSSPLEANLPTTFPSTTTQNNFDHRGNYSTVSAANTTKLHSKRHAAAQPRYTVKRVNVDINYNERFYWIGPNQMRMEHHKALERGLPYPILTVVEYLSQDEAGFSWSRQYRLAGYYTYIIMWLALCTCVLMFVLHCAAPKYGIYTMQLLGCILLAANLTYAILVPRGEQKLVIPFEGQSLAFQFGWNFWLVLIGGCVSLFVGTLIVIVDFLFPNFIFTTILDVDFERHRTQCPPEERQDRQMQRTQPRASLAKTERPPFLNQQSHGHLRTITRPLDLVSEDRAKVDSSQL